MKKIIISLALILSSMTMQAATKIDHIEPENWYVGMKNSSLQLMVYGKNIRDSHVSVDYPGVKIDSLVRLDSPNYLFVYLNLSGAKPGNMVLNIDGKKVNYPLKARTMSGDKRIGFDNSDVLYMLMPDRFASGCNITKPMKGLNPYVVDRSKPSLRHGGDLEGVRQHLDYFNQLGVTALWFTPVLENNLPDMNSQSSYHGYATTNYYRVDPRFGTNEDYARLVAEAHAKGLKVVMDMIF
ncbi:cyclomaltodextrinase N-terminal domain-containing protein, partial [Segatella salivae]|uniref:cyclomaltodextrinase N-terminal domain-containing protein n=1 Tax=Segatella salivae TaxID=228604 RepID=UPI001CB18ECD